MIQLLLILTNGRETWRSEKKNNKKKKTNKKTKSSSIMDFVIMENEIRAALDKHVPVGHSAIY